MTANNCSLMSKKTQLLSLFFPVCYQKVKKTNKIFELFCFLIWKILELLVKIVLKHNIPLFQEKTSTLKQDSFFMDMVHLQK